MPPATMNPQPPAECPSDKAWSARHFTSLPDGQVACGLCPRTCRIPPGDVGACRVRRNAAGKLIADSYGKPAAMHVDPIEKKPLAWFLPGSRAFSIGTYGCNLACQFCQNDELSRHGGPCQRALPFVPPEDIVALAQRHDCQSVAFTYNEPTVFFEYMLDIARLARAAGLKTVLVSNGYINPKPRNELYPWIDAANIDIKAFSDSFYADLCDASLVPVLASCRTFKRDFHGHLEITNLLIPNRNDAPAMIADMLDWIAEALGCDTPVHFSAYFPRGGFDEPPTPPATVQHAVELARQRGFTRVRAGNI